MHEKMQKKLDHVWFLALTSQNIVVTSWITAMERRVLEARRSETTPSVTLSEDAQRQFEGLLEEQREVLIEGVVRAYMKVLRLCLDLQVSSYLHISQLMAWQMLVSESIVTFSIDGFAVRVEIDQATFEWHIVSIGLPGCLRNFQVRALG